MVEDVHVGVEERDRAAVRHAGSLQEVASTGTHVEVAAAQVPPVSLREASRRAPPHDWREEAEDQGIVNLQEERGVFTLALVRGVVTFHRDRPLGGSCEGVERIFARVRSGHPPPAHGWRPRSRAKPTWPRSANGPARVRNSSSMAPRTAAD